MSKQRTASQLMAELLADPIYVARMEAQERARQERQAQSRLEERDLINALQHVGVVVESVWDLVNRREAYPDAILILVAALQRPYSAKIREGIVRALTVKEARGQAGAPILTMLRETPLDQEDFRWVLANALTRASTADMLEALTETMSAEQDTRVKKRLQTAIKSLPKSKGRGTQSDSKT